MTEATAHSASPDLLGLLVEAFNNGAAPELIIDPTQVSIRAQRVLGNVDDARIGYVRSEAPALPLSPSRS